MEIRVDHKYRLCQRLHELALSMRSVALSLEGIGREDKAKELRGAADAAEQWAGEMVNEKG